MNTQAQNVKAFDLSNLGSIKNPTFKVGFVSDEDGNPTVGFEIVGKNSPEYQAIMNEQRSEGIRRGANRKTAIDQKTEEGAKALADIISKNERRIAVGVVKNWFGINEEGAEANFNAATVPKLYQAFPQWQAAVLTALDNDANFPPV